ncbi:germinal-center associated nuclear protein [Ambystoma mexicanum]|uniref:germinal-center associated nuclear protein n=1 Tax=Ambystoma mexicanum TaxID=8296 RepID=UPI0037E7EF4C
MNTNNPFGSPHSGASNPFGQQSGPNSTFERQQSGTSNLFGAQQSETGNAFGSPQSGVSNAFGGLQSGGSNLFGQSQSGASSTFGGHQAGGTSAFSGPQLRIFPVTSSSATSAFQAQQPFQFGQPSSFGQGSGTSTQPPSFGQAIEVTGKNPTFGHGASVPGQTSLFGQGSGSTVQTSSFGQGDATSRQTLLFGQNSGSSGQTALFGQSSRPNVFGQVNGAPGQTSAQGCGIAGQNSGFGQSTGVGGQPVGFGQAGVSPAKGTSFGNDHSATGQSTLFMPASGTPGQAVGFRPNNGAIGQPSSFKMESGSVGQTASNLPVGSGGAGQSLAFSQSSELSQASSRPPSGFGQSSAFGQPSIFTQPSGISQVTSLGTAATAPSISSSAGDQGFSYKPSLRSSTFPVPSTLRKTPAASTGVPECAFKPPEHTTFKPIFEASPEPEKSKSQITPESFTFSQPTSSTPAVMAQVRFSSPSTSTNLNTGHTLGFSKPAPTGAIAPAFAFPLPNRKGDEETQAPKAPFGSVGSSFISFSSSSAAPPSLGQTSKAVQSIKQEKEQRGGTSEQPDALLKGQKRKDGQDCSLHKLDYATTEDPEQTPKSDRPPEKRSLLLNRPDNKLFGRALKDVFKSNEITGRFREVKREEEFSEARELEQPGASQAIRTLLPTPAAGPGLEEAKSNKGKRRGSTGKNLQLRRRNSSADSIGDLSPSELTSIQIKNIPDHLNKLNVIKKRFNRYGKIVRVICKPEKKTATIHFQNHVAAESARNHEQSWHKGISIFFFKKKTSPGKKLLSSAGKLETMVSESSGRQSADEQSYQRSPQRTTLVRSSVSAGSLLSKGSPIKKSGSSKALPFDADSFDSGSDGHSSDSVVSSLSASLSHMSSTLVENAEERYRALDQRDRILRQARVKRTELERAQVFVGTCPDMCPEKERYMRESRNQLSIYELIPGTDKVDHAAVVKEYSRSSADQEEPLPHELRPTPVLCMTMDYIIGRIMDQGEGNYREWYDFVWNRTRAIRKDITQQHLCDPATVSLIEKCMRFHIHCAHQLCEEPRSAFEAKINLENTTKCLQSLKEMYQDLANKGIRCNCEAEFRGYSVLLNLNKGDILREVQQFQPDVRNSPEVKFAVQAFAAFNNTNFVRFFRLVKSATYLSGCILHSYFNQIRRQAIIALNVAYTSNQRSTTFPVETVMRMLLFKDVDEATEFVASYGLSVSDGFVELSRPSFNEPEDLPKPQKSVFIEQKRSVSVGEVVNGGPLPHLAPHVPVCSFNNQNKYVGDGLCIEPVGSSPRVAVEVLVPSQPAGAPVFTPRQALIHSSAQPELPSGFIMQPPLLPPAVQQEPPKPSTFSFQQPVVQPAESSKISGFTFQQPLVRSAVQSEPPSAFTVQPAQGQPAAMTDAPKASDFTFQQPPVRPSVQQKPPKASEFMFQVPLIRTEAPSAFSVQPPLGQPIVQPAPPATSAFTVPHTMEQSTLHSELQPASFTMTQPLVVPIAPPKPEFKEQQISEVVEELVEEYLKEHCKVMSESGAAYASAALCVSKTTANELLTTVAAELMNCVVTEEMNVEKRRLELVKRREEEEKKKAKEEKRRAEEAKRRAEEDRLKQERIRLIEMLSKEICSELAEEVLKESTMQTSSIELKSAFDEDRRLRIARCSDQVSHHWTELFLQEEIFQTAKEALQELQCYCKYLQRWREVVVARKKLRRQMRAFPAAPCCVDRRGKLKALLPSAVSPADRDLLSKGILQLGHAGNLGVSYTRLQWLKEQTVHQMKVQHFHQQLLCEAAWTPLDLPSLIAENLSAYRENVFWKVVLVLPDSEDYQDDGCSRLLAEWLKAKFLRLEEFTPPASDEDRIQTLATYEALGVCKEQPVRIHVCVKVTLGTLSNMELDQAETQKNLLGTSGLVLLLPPSVCSGGLAEEDVYWLSALLQLKQLLQVKPFHPIVPLVVLVPVQDEPSMNLEEEVEEGLMLQDLISAKLISEYIIVQIPQSINGLQGSTRISQAVKWLVSHIPTVSELSCQTLLQFIEDGVCREFSVPFHHDRAQRRQAGLSSQDPSAIVELYNSVLLFLAEVVSSEKLSELSWPVTEFAEPGGNLTLPHLQWNTAEHLMWLKKVVLSFQIPHMDLPPLAAPWRPVCSMIFQYVAQIPSSLLTQPILESQVDNLLSKTYASWKRQECAYPEEDGPSVQEIPWGDILILCIDHKLRDWKPPRSPIISEALMEDGHVGVYFFKEDLKMFVQPLSWEEARMKTLKAIEQEGLESALVSRSWALELRKRTLRTLPPIQDATTDIALQTPHDMDLTYVPSREELLPEQLSLSLKTEKAESQRFEDQLNQWLAEDPAEHLEEFSPRSIQQTRVGTDDPLQPRRSPPSSAFAGSPIEGTQSSSETFTSLSDRLEQLRNMIQSSKEQEAACDLHLSTLLEVMDN